VRNILGEVTEIIDPLGRKTTKEYDNAGNIKILTDPENVPPPTHTIPRVA
jgi:YD repeat-containing protein